MSTTISTFFVRGSHARFGRFGTLYIPMGTRGTQIAEALNTPGVLDADWDRDELVICVMDAEKVKKPEIKEKGVVLETTDATLISKLTQFAKTSRFVVDNNAVVEKEKPAPKPNVAPVEPFSVAFRFTSGGNWDQQGLVITVDDASKPCLQELAELGVVSCVNGFVRGHACQQCATRVGHDADGKLVLTTNHPGVARILAKYTRLIREMATVFSLHQRFFREQLKALEVEAAFKQREAELTDMMVAEAAAGFKPVHVMPAKATSVVEAPTKPARKSRAKATQVAVTA